MCCNKPQLIHFELVQVNFKHNLVFPDAINLIAPFCYFGPRSIYPGIYMMRLLPIFLLQWNEVGNSTGMEFEGFKRSFDFLKSHNFKIDTFVSDRHGSIAKHMREKEIETTHYFD